MLGLVLLSWTQSLYAGLCTLPLKILNCASPAPAVDSQAGAEHGDGEGRASPATAEPVFPATLAPGYEAGAAGAQLDLGGQWFF